MLNILEIVRTDIQRYKRGTMESQGSWYLVWHTPGLKTLLVYRLGKWLRRCYVKPLWWPLIVLITPLSCLLATYYRLAYDIHLDQSADIGSGLFIAHFGGIKVRNCRIGDHCSIHQQVTLEPKSSNSIGPTIGNHVWIGAHTQILGKITVGDNSTIGAGTQVTHDVATGCLYMGKPARVVKKDYDNSIIL